MEIITLIEYLDLFDTLKLSLDKNIDKFQIFCEQSFKIHLTLDKEDFQNFDENIENKKKLIHTLKHKGTSLILDNNIAKLDRSCFSENCMSYN